MAHVPAAVDELAREPVEQLGVARRRALHAEVVQRRDDPRAEEEPPQPVDEHAGRRAGSARRRASSRGRAGRRGARARGARPSAAGTAGSTTSPDSSIQSPRGRTRVTIGATARVSRTSGISRSSSAMRSVSSAQRARSAASSGVWARWATSKRRACAAGRSAGGQAASSRSSGSTAASSPGASPLTATRHAPSVWREPCSWARASSSVRPPMGSASSNTAVAGFARVACHEDRPTPARADTVVGRGEREARLLRARAARADGHRRAVDADVELGQPRGCRCPRARGRPPGAPGLRGVRSAAPSPAPEGA